MHYRKFELLISKKLNNYAQQYAKDNEIFNGILKKYFQKKIHLIGIRFFAPFYDLQQEMIIYKEKMLPLAIALELCMQQAYITNMILDEKKDVWGTKDSIKNLILEKDLIMLLIYQLIEKSDIQREAKNFFREKISLILHNITLGFLQERKLVYRNDIFSTFEQDYKKRNILLNRVYDYSILFAHYFLYKTDVFEKYHQVELPFSYSGQIINDLSDFSSLYDENVKVYQDNFSDIKNKLVTYPIYLLYKKGMDISLFFKGETTKEIFIHLKRAIVENNIVDEVIGIARKSYLANMKFIENYLSLNETSLTAKSFRLLLDNKYYKSFKI